MIFLMQKEEDSLDVLLMRLDCQILNAEILRCEVYRSR